MSCGTDRDGKATCTTGGHGNHKTHGMFVHFVPSFQLTSVQVFFSLSNVFELFCLHLQKAGTYKGRSSMLYVTFLDIKLEDRYLLILTAPTRTWVIPATLCWLDFSSSFDFLRYSRILTSNNLLVPGARSRCFSLSCRRSERLHGNGDKFEGRRNQLALWGSPNHC